MANPQVMASGTLPAFAISIALVAAYLQGPVSSGGSLPLPTFAILNNALAWGITMASLGVIALESFSAAACGEAWNPPTNHTHGHGRHLLRPIEPHSCPLVSPTRVHL